MIHLGGAYNIGPAPSSTAAELPQSVYSGVA